MKEIKELLETLKEARVLIASDLTSRWEEYEEADNWLLQKINEVSNILEAVNN